MCNLPFLFGIHGYFYVLYRKPSSLFVHIVQTQLVFSLLNIVFCARCGSLEFAFYWIFAKDRQIKRYSIQNMHIPFGHIVGFCALERFQRVNPGKLLSSRNAVQVHSAFSFHLQNLPNLAHKILHPCKNRKLFCIYFCTPCTGKKTRCAGEAAHRIFKPRISEAQSEVGCLGAAGLDRRPRDKDYHMDLGRYRSVILGVQEAYFAVYSPSRRYFWSCSWVMWPMSR